MTFDQIHAEIQPLRQALLTHPIYHDLADPRALQIFMEFHVFAVWDFMSLLKCLQRQLTCVAIPWVPAADQAQCRFINEIVLGEESDADGLGGFGSHFELYLRAMEQFGANTAGIVTTIEAIRSGQSVTEALKTAQVPSAIQHFVGHTFREIESGNTCRIASAFTFGREDLLPGVFQLIVDELSQTADGDLDIFRFYLQRHIDLDSGEHGPLAERLITSLCGSNPENWNQVIDAAIGALTSRLNLWDAIHSAILRIELS